jgi:hypothetical protein
MNCVEGSVLDPLFLATGLSVLARNMDFDIDVAGAGLLEEMVEREEEEVILEMRVHKLLSPIEMLTNQSLRSTTDPFAKQQQSLANY